MIIGFAAGILVGGKAAPVTRFFAAVADVMYKMAEAVIKVTPIGVFGSMAGAVDKGREAAVSERLSSSRKAIHRDGARPR